MTIIILPVLLLSLLLFFSRTLRHIAIWLLFGGLALYALLPAAHACDIPGEQIVPMMELALKTLPPLAPNEMDVRAAKMRGLAAQLLNATVRDMCAAKKNPAMLDESYVRDGITRHDLRTLSVMALTRKVLTSMVAATERLETAQRRLAEDSPQQLYAVLVCIDGAGCRAFDSRMVFTGRDKCTEYTERFLQETFNVHYECMPVSYEQGDFFR